MEANHKGSDSLVFVVIACVLFVTADSRSALVDVIVPSGNARSVGISQPGVDGRAVEARFHVPGVADVRGRFLEGQGTLVGDVTGFGRLGGSGLAVPRFVIVELVQRLGVGDPGQGLRYRHEPHVGAGNKTLG